MSSNPPPKVLSPTVSAAQMPSYKFPNQQYEHAPPPDYSAQNYDVNETTYPLFNRGSTSPIVRFADLEVKKTIEWDERLKQRIRGFRFIVRALDLGCSIVVISLLASNLALFNSSRLVAEGQTSPWGSQGETKTWPSVVLLCVACVSALISILILLSYMRSVKWANRLAVVHGTLTIAGSLGLLIAWAISVGVFKIHDKDNAQSDLWSWACAHTAAEHPSVNWQQVCMEQDWCSACAFIAIALELMTLASFCLVFLRRKSKKEIRRSIQYSTFRQESIPLHLQSHDTIRGHQGRNRDQNSSEYLLELTVPENEKLRPVVYAREHGTYV